MSSGGANDGMVQIKNVSKRYITIEFGKGDSKVTKTWSPALDEKMFAELEKSDPNARILSHLQKVPRKMLTEARKDPRFASLFEGARAPLQAVAF